jgi:hypothetical protein
MSALEKKGVVEPSLTLHGLRVSFAAGIKRKRKRAVSNAAVAAVLGDLRSATVMSGWARTILATSKTS